MTTLPNEHSSPIRWGLKQASLLWYDDLHQAQDKATISFELNDNFACNDCGGREGNELLVMLDGQRHSAKKTLVQEEEKSIRVRSGGPRNSRWCNIKDGDKPTRVSICKIVSNYAKVLAQQISLLKVVQTLHHEISFAIKKLRFLRCSLDEFPIFSFRSLFKQWHNMWTTA